MLDWHFKELEPDYPDDTSLAERNFRRESRKFPEIFIREIVQNVLDARDEDQAKPVKLVIRLVDESDGLNANRFREVFEPLEGHLTAAEHDVERDYDHPRALVAEEYGTLGLTGHVDNSRARGEGERWSNFWHGEGKKTKGGRSLGRAGQGKITYHMASASQALVALSARKADQPQQYVFGKCIVKKSHALGQKHYMRHGYWRRLRPDLKLQPLPADDEKFVAQFAKDFLLKRKTGQTGTSWVIPFPSPSLTKEALIKALLSDFHFSILKGVLTVEICGTEIDQDSVTGLIARYMEPKVISPQFVSFLEDVITTNGADRVTVRDDWKFDDATLDRASFSDAEFEALQERFKSGKMVSVRFPVRISRSDGSESKSFFDAYLSKPDDLERTEELYVRSDLVIGDEKWLKDVSGRALGAVTADDDGISEFLGHAEEASHLKWNAEEDELRSRYKVGEARELLARVRHSLPRLYRLLAGQMTGINEDALQHILSIPDNQTGKKKSAAGGKKPKNTKNDDDDDDEKKKWKSNPKPFVFIDTADGIRILPGDQKLAVGTIAEIRLAYARVEGEGNPFAHYHPFDFDLEDDAQIIIQDQAGLTIVGRSENLLKIRIDDPVFSIQIGGFLAAYRLVCKSRIIAAKSDAVLEDAGQ